MLQYLGVCSELANLPKSTQPDSTHRVESVFKGWWVRLGHEFIYLFFTMGWVGVGS